MIYFVCLLFISPLPARVPLADGVLIYSFKFFDDSIYAVDFSEGDPVFVRFDSRGRIEKTYKAIGAGPGEYIRLQHVAGDEAHLYLYDKKQFKIIVLDHDLFFVEQFKLPEAGRCRGMVVTDDAYYFQYYNVARNKVLHQFSKNREHQISFGMSFDKSELSMNLKRFSGQGFSSKDRFRIRFSDGDPAIIEKTIVLNHHYRFRLDLYQSDGSWIRGIRYPDLDAARCFNEKTGKFLVKGGNMVTVGDHVFVGTEVPRDVAALGITDLPPRRFYEFDLGQNRVRSTSQTPYAVAATSDGRLFELRSDLDRAQENDIDPPLVLVEYHPDWGPWREQHVITAVASSASLSRQK